MIKMLRILEIKWNFFNMMEKIDEKPTANNILNGKLKALPLRLEIRKWCSHATVIELSTGSSSKRKYAIKSNRRHINWKS